MSLTTPLPNCNVPYRGNCHWDCRGMKMQSGGPYLPVMDELESAVGGQKTKRMCEEQKQKIKKKKEIGEKLWQVGLNRRHPVK